MKLKMTVNDDDEDESFDRHFDLSKIHPNVIPCRGPHGGSTATSVKPMHKHRSYGPATARMTPLPRRLHRKHLLSLLQEKEKEKL